MDSAITDEDVRLEFLGSQVHKFSSNGGASYSPVAGSFIPGIANGTQNLVQYFPGQAITAASAPNQRWIFESQSTKSVTTIAPTYSVTIDQSLPSVPQAVAGAPSTTND